MTVKLFISAITKFLFKNQIYFLDMSRCALGSWDKTHVSPSRLGSFVDY